MAGAGGNPNLDELFAPLRELIERGREQAATLLVLAVHLLFRPHATVVNLRLSGCGEHDNQDNMSWELPFVLFEPRPGELLRLPATLAHDVLYRLSTAGQGAPGTQPLWLRLARPYGKLAALPWEWVLGPALGRPVLRLPDYPDRPAQRPGTVEHVVLVDPPTDADSAQVEAMVRALAGAILAGSAPGGCHVHVFTQARWFDRLAPLADPPRVLVHVLPAAAAASAGQAPPAAASAATAQAPPPAATVVAGQAAPPAAAFAAAQAPATAAAPSLRAAPWSNWISETMASQGVDAVHLVCRAHGGDDTAQLWLSGSLAADDTALVLIDQDELCLLLDRAGAWALTMVPVVRAQAGALAFVADGVAHHRPGAVLFHAIDDPEDEIALRAACAFLFAGQPSPAPALRDGFLYCHPSFVAADTGAASAQAASAAADVGLLALQASQPQSGRGPDWIGSAQRFVESAALEQVRKVGSDVLLSGALSKRTPPDAASSGAASTSSVATLSAIRNVVQDFLKTEPKE